MSTTIAFEIDDDTAARLGDSPDAVSAAVKEAAVLELYRRHDITGSQGARLLAVSLESFLKFAGSHQIPIFDITPEELREEVLRSTPS